MTNSADRVSELKAEIAELVAHIDTLEPGVEKFNADQKRGRLVNDLWNAEHGCDAPF